MKFLPKTIFFVAMAALMIVSMWTTYQSLYDSILPEPIININFGNGFIWPCSIFAMLLSVAIGLMLFALKMAIIDEQKRLNILGIVGLLTVGFISISFNLDVLYRTADRDFFINYSNSRMKGVYEEYLAKAQGTLQTKRDELLKQVAKQEGELDAEIRGLRDKPAGYGSEAKQEDYELTLLQKTSTVELDTIEQTIARKQEADTLLATSAPATITEIEQLQHQLRVIIKDIGAAAAIPMPPVVRLENPLFAVFSKIFDFQAIGYKEVFFVVLAILLDLGDILGYSMVPNRKRRKHDSAGDDDFITGTLSNLQPLPPGDLILPETQNPAAALPAGTPNLQIAANAQTTDSPIEEASPAADPSQYPLRRPKRPFTFRRH